MVLRNFNLFLFKYQFLSVLISATKIEIIPEKQFVLFNLCINLQRFCINIQNEKSYPKTACN